MSQENIVTPKVFISYSWTVQDKTIELATRLLANGIDIILDVYDLKDGQDKYAFMEQSVNDPTVNHVLIICDKTYAEKANARAGGVGDETVIITPEIYGNAEQTKFIPVIFEKDENGNAYRPTYIKSRIYVDLSDENTYEAEYEKLLRDLYHKPLFQKPALGRKPEWLENETVDFSAIRDGIKQLKGLSDTKSTKAECLIRRTADNFTEVIKQYKCTGAKDLNVEFLELIDKSKNYRNLIVEYFQVLLEGGYSCSEIFVEFFEKLYNDTHDATEDTKYSTQDAEFFDFLIWEIFISTTALLLHFEKYQDLYSILSHKYYLRISSLSHKFDFYDYGYFRTASQIIENIRNQTEPRPITLAGKIIVEREEKPILTKDAICNADIVLYQLGKILLGNNKYGFIKWFPTTYIYYDKTQTIWHKLRSQKHCLKITSLFGVKTIQELKTILQQAQSQNPLGYPSAWDYAPEILSSIQIEEIGTLP